MYKRKKISEDASSFKDDENPISMFFHLLETGTIFFFIQDNFFKENEMLWARVPSRLECMCACMLSRFSHVCLCNTVGCSPPGSFVHGGFSRQEYWRGLPCPSPGDLPKPGMEPMSPSSPVLVGRFFTTALPAYWASLVAQLVKNLPAMPETWVQSWVGKIPWRRKRLLTPVFWPGELHGLYSPCGCRFGHYWATFTTCIL